MEDKKLKDRLSIGGAILIDKPLEWTSFDVVKKIRYATKVQKIGHAGTLDPLATGLLILCFGKHTKKIESIQAQEKVYKGIFNLGKTTPSFDLETEFDGEFDISNISQETINKVLPKFLGNTQQIPPIYSAVKIDGKRAYDYARSGKTVEIKPKNIEIYEFKANLSGSELHFFIRCSKGTYIRSIARDLGKTLGCGAYLSDLRREKIGNFDVKNSFLPNDISNLDLLLEKSIVL
jgi:tRNA pseudouridine55 synthase